MSAPAPALREEESPDTKGGTPCSVPWATLSRQSSSRSTALRFRLLFQPRCHGCAGAYLEPMFSSPPRGQLLWWHVDDRHNVPHLQKVNSISHSQEESTVPITTVSALQKTAKLWSSCTSAFAKLSYDMEEFLDYPAQDTAVPKEKGLKSPGKGYRRVLLKLQ